jgi:hypothetical protein
VKNDRFEWLHQERARVAPEGTGARYVRYQLRQYYLRSVGIAVATLPVFLIMDKLPARSDGHLQPIPVFVLGLGTLAAGIVALRSGARRYLVGWWAGWTAIGFGALLALMSALV